MNIDFNEIIKGINDEFRAGTGVKTADLLPAPGTVDEYGQMSRPSLSIPLLSPLNRDTSPVPSNPGLPKPLTPVSTASNYTPLPPLSQHPAGSELYQKDLEDHIKNIPRARGALEPGVGIVDSKSNLANNPEAKFTPFQGTVVSPEVSTGGSIPYYPHTPPPVPQVDASGEFRNKPTEYYPASSGAAQTTSPTGTPKTQPPKWYDIKGQVSAGAEEGIGKALEGAGLKDATKAVTDIVSQVKAMGGNIQNLLNGDFGKFFQGPGGTIIPLTLIAATLYSLFSRGGGSGGGRAQNININLGGGPPSIFRNQGVGSFDKYGAFKLSSLLDISPDAVDLSKATEAINDLQIPNTLRNSTSNLGFDRFDTSLPDSTNIDPSLSMWMPNGGISAADSFRPDSLRVGPTNIDSQILSQALGDKFPDQSGLYASPMDKIVDDAKRVIEQNKPKVNIPQLNNYEVSAAKKYFENLRYARDGSVGPPAIGTDSSIPFAPHVSASGSAINPKTLGLGAATGGLLAYMLHEQNKKKDNTSQIPSWAGVPKQANILVNTLADAAKRRVANKVIDDVVGKDDRHEKKEKSESEIELVSKYPEMKKLLADKQNKAYLESLLKE